LEANFLSWAIAVDDSNRAADKVTTDVRRMVTLPNDIPMTFVVNMRWDGYPPFVGWSTHGLY